MQSVNIIFLLMDLLRIMVLNVIGSILTRIRSSYELKPAEVSLARGLPGLF